MLGASGVDSEIQHCEHHGKLVSNNWLRKWHVLGARVVLEVIEPIGRDAAGDPMDEARSMLFAARRVHKGRSLSEALADAPKAEPPVDTELVEATYEALMGVRVLGEKPDRSAKIRARDWLRSTA